ncbi:MAG: 50S ribosomal protein L18 [Patescibacteria group bacterium]
MNLRKITNQKRVRRTKRTRARIFGTADKPRLVVFRSNRFIYAQLIDDSAQRTLLSASDRGLDKGAKTKNKSALAEAIGEALAKKADAAGIKRVVFDRRAYAYHGRVKALAEGARKGGLKF